jgi:hypothetical protein
MNSIVSIEKWSHWTAERFQREHGTCHTHHWTDYKFVTCGSLVSYVSTLVIFNRNTLKNLRDTSYFLPTVYQDNDPPSLPIVGSAFIGLPEHSKIIIHDTIRELPCSKILETSIVLLYYYIVSRQFFLEQLHCTLRTKNPKFHGLVWTNKYRCYL